MHFPPSTPLRSPFAQSAPAGNPAAGKSLIEILAASEQPITVSPALNTKHIWIGRPWVMEMHLAGRLLYHRNHLASLLDVFMHGPANAFMWNAKTGELTLPFTHEGVRYQASCQCGPDGEVIRICFKKMDSLEAPFELRKPDRTPPRLNMPVTGSADFLARQAAQRVKGKRTASPEAEVPSPHRLRMDEGEGTSPSKEGESQEAQMDWDNQVAPALREVLGMEELGVALEENRACMTESYAHHTKGGTEALSDEAIEELKSTHRLLQGLEREGWNIRAWGEACRSYKAPLANPSPEMLNRLGVTRADVASALGHVRGKNKLEGVTQPLGNYHPMPKETEHIGYFSDPKFLKAWQVPETRLHTAFFRLVTWLENGYGPLSDDGKPIRSLWKWVVVKDDVWRPRLEAYLSSQHTSGSQTSARSGLNQLRNVISPPLKPTDEELARQKLDKAWDSKINGFSELKEPAHRNVLIAFYRELLRKPGPECADGLPRDDDPKWSTLGAKTKDSVGGARNLLENLERAEKTYRKFIEEQKVGHLTGYAFFQALIRPLKTQMEKKSVTELKNFITSDATRAVMHRQATVSASGS